MTPDEKIERIKKALAITGSHSWEDVMAGLVDGRFQIFDNDHGVWITEIIQAPKKRTLHCWIVAGELPGVMDLQDAVEKHALANTCECITAEARPGWKHVAREYGWQQTSIIIAKDLVHA